MAYSKAYQLSPRNREDEAISFFGQNKVALPSRVTNFVNQGAGKEPTIVEDFMSTDRVGKINNTVPALNTYIPNKVHNS